MVTTASASQPSAISARLTVRTLTPLAGAICLLVSLLGVTWVHLPADPLAKSPAESLSYHDMGNLFSTPHVPTTWLQDNYFNWLAWVLVILAAAAAVAAFLFASRRLALALAVIGILGLILTVFAFKGQMTWSQYWDARSNLRIGGYLAFLGYLLALVGGLLQTRRRPTA